MGASENERRVNVVPDCRIKTCGRRAILGFWIETA